VRHNPPPTRARCSIHTRPFKDYAVFVLGAVARAWSRYSNSWRDFFLCIEHLMAPNQMKQPTQGPAWRGWLARQPCGKWVARAACGRWQALAEEGDPSTTRERSTGGSRCCAARAEDAQGTPTQSHISSSILVYDDTTTDGHGRARHSAVHRQSFPCENEAFYPKVDDLQYKSSRSLIS